MSESNQDRLKAVIVVKEKLDYNEQMIYHLMLSVTVSFIIQRCDSKFANLRLVFLLLLLRSAKMLSNLGFIFIGFFAVDFIASAIANDERKTLKHAKIFRFAAFLFARKKKKAGKKFCPSDREENLSSVSANSLHLIETKRI